MIWTLLRFYIFLAIVVAAAFGILYLIENEGGIAISFAGREYPFTPVEVLIAAVVLMIAFFILQKVAGFLVAVLRFLTGDETAISRFWNRSRERRGFEALTDGLVALASGDGRTALVKAAKAENKLRRPELTRLVSAQAAELAGDTERATGYYKEMLADDRTRFVGIHGLMRQKLSDGDTDRALKLAEKAFALKPKHQAVVDTLFSLQSQADDWAGARKTLAAKVNAKALPRDVAQRRDAVLSVADAQDALIDGRTDQGLAMATEAARIAPGLVPAAALAAREIAKSGNERKAARIIKKAWGQNPHPDLAAAFASFVEEETPAARRKRFGALLSIQPDHPETKMLSAELALADEDFPGARRALGDLAETAPTTRSVAIMAAIERGEGADDRVVRGWLVKALTVSHGPQWVCSSCNHSQPKWAPTCDHCEAFDTLDWKAPDAKSGATEQTTAAMLPLIIGALEQPVEDDAEQETVLAEDARAEDTPPEAEKAS